MPDARRPALVTGATGLLGSHIAEQLIRRGDAARALVRPTSDTRFLRSLGVELVPGDLTVPEDCRRAVQGASTVFHAAAKVGDWGTWAEFQAGCLDATANLARASVEAGVQRFLHISSTSAYGHPREGGPPVGEDAPLGQNLWPFWDYYTRSKVEQERFLWRMAHEDGLPLTIIRPSWLFGERDRTTVARLVRRLERGGLPLIGPGDNPLSAIDAREVAGAALLAADDPASVGHAYNVTDQGPITQRAYFDLWAESCGAPPIGRRRSYPMVFAGALALEALGRFAGRTRPPLITRYATWLMGRNLVYSSAKVRERLGWTPQRTYRESIERAVAWYRGSNPPADAGRPSPCCPRNPPT
jgi:nucleoside-diphosphate-sugar epimerase